MEMTEYTGNYFTIENSTVFNGKTVNVLEMVSDSGREKCFRCGATLRKRWFVVQTADDDLELCTVGIKCVHKLA